MTLSTHFQLSIFKTDAYKFHHREQYPKGTTKVFSNLTPRSNKHFKVSDLLYKGHDKIVVYGLKYTIFKLIEDWHDNFFNRDWSVISRGIESFIEYSGIDISKNVPYYKELHEFGGLPLKFNFIEDYTEVNIKTNIKLI